MEWNRSRLIGLAKPSCVHCKGAGIRETPGGRHKPCYCSFRSIFRACYNRFRECAELSHRTNAVSLESFSGHGTRRTYSRKGEEYMADFCLVARRTLDAADHEIFRYHFLLGGDWRLCCRQLRVEKGDFFHRLYKIERQLGKVFAELEPYPLFPLNEYFGGVVEREMLPETETETETEGDPEEETGPLLMPAA